ncbi:hypothetical protein J437_LFUL010142 [Ladona fulva]|uniref:2-hydroxyacyl-CoA lyase 2 n=1 Tax=Ladona fulva TaxID=123851 RepID=A0A8K0K7R1_LADFU|nr:hypothetical protein J437_LFUL010142 [Ladona fulva]
MLERFGLEETWPGMKTAATTLATIIGAALIYRKIRHYFKKADVPEDFHGGTIVAHCLKQHDVHYMFTLIGGHISPIIVAAEKMGIRVVDTRNEVGVAVVTAGPGVTNCVTAAKNAQLAESPVLIIGGAAATILKGRGALQDIDQMTLFSSVCKFTGSASTVQEIAPLLQKAIQISMSEIPGPVFVELPVDILYQYPVVASQLLGTTNNKSVMSTLREWYLQLHLNNLYSDWKMLEPFAPLPVFVPRHKKSQVLKAARLLRESKRPFIIIGSQAMLPPVSSTILQAALRDLNIPVSLGGMARGLLGKDSALQFRHSRKFALKSADLIILAGAVCDFRLSYGRSLSSKATIISVNRDEAKASLNAGIYWKPSMVIRGDVACFLVEFSSLSAGYSYDIKWYTTILEVEEKRCSEITEASMDDTSEYLNPIQLLTELDKQLPANSVIIGDGGDFVATASYVLQPSAPLSWLDPGPFGTLGVGGGFAIGAKLARPEAMIWVIYGDGACGYSIMEYDTFIRHDLPVISVRTDYHTVAKGLGAEGLLLTKENDWRNVLSKAVKIHRDGTSTLINALISRSDFRQGSISL